MQDFFGFFVAVIVISASGVMSPGPLFAATVSSALRRGGRAGLYVAAGHTVIELPLIILLGLGVFSFEAFPQFRVTISILGALSIFAFAGIQIYSTMKTQDIKESKYSAFATGVLLTGLNPFFLIWWFTIGIKLIFDALVLWAFWGTLIMFVMHIWMDYAWLFFVSSLSSKGKSFLSDRRYRMCMIAINSILIYFGVSFILEVV
ncbi:MAG TPA: LysE family transporter [Candidatus Nitrosotenuis sp.]|nr:LysE family transporter [Candidatus Nitrosotenuis sp.]